MTRNRPSYDHELAKIAAEVATEPVLRVSDIAAARALWPAPDIRELLLGQNVEFRDDSLSAVDGHPVSLSLFAPTARTRPACAVLLIHGGGMFLGHRHHEAARAIGLVQKHNALVVTVDYRLAPEFPHPTPVEDCFAALRWTRDYASAIDVEALLVGGTSAGGGLAAAVALMARDRRGPRLAGQMLLSPMLDCSNDSPSTRQFSDLGLWDARENAFGWQALLGEKYEPSAVSPYASPARAESLVALPPAYIEVGSVEVFRDEVTYYAQRLWEAGGDAELHVWSGGFHDFESLAPNTRISRASRAARNSWLARRLRAIEHKESN